eukprot:3533403-Amphidinium_carterae.1
MKACVYPRDALQGLLTLDWTRIVVKLQLPKATVHVFLLGKEMCTLQNSGEPSGNNLSQAVSSMMLRQSVK